MASRSFISSRWGKIKVFIVYRYNFSPELNSQNEQKEKFINWLKKSTDILLYKLEDSCFFTFKPLQKKENWQYSSSKKIIINPPFENPSLISLYCGKLLRDLYAQKYKQYFNKNIFVVDKEAHNPFQLLKCFEFNIEVFSNGEFFIHLMPSTKIVSSAFVSESYTRSLITSNKNNKNTDNMVFRLIEGERFKSRKFDLLDKDCLKRVEAYIDNRQNVIASYDYHFIANHSPNAFGWITEHTIKDLTSSIDFLVPIAEMVVLPSFIELHDKPFFEIEIGHPKIEKNLLVGGNRRVKEQSAAFYNGIFQPVINKVILPVIVNKMDISLFRELVERFNKNGEVEILEAIKLSSENDIDEKIFIELKKCYGNNLLICIFSRYKQPDDFFVPIKKLRLQFQVYQGEINPHQLSNYVVKCLEKMGGLLSIISNTFEPEDTYFVGIDLGHTTQVSEKFSNLGVVFFDNCGRHITHNVVRKLPRNEEVNQEALIKAMCACIYGLQNRRLTQPKKIIIHRDGKMHDQDYDTIKHAITQVLEVKNYDIVEIIKSGHPVIAAHNGMEYYNLESGSSWMFPGQRYAILVTNTQAKTEKGAVLNPIIIKHAFGNTPFDKIVDQVYSFTKIYTNNLYNSTRLPATTEKANNVVGTGKRRFISSYLG